MSPSESIRYPQRRACLWAAAVLPVAALAAAPAFAAHRSAHARSSAAPASVLGQLALAADADSATLTLELSSPVDEHVFRMGRPERLVIDLPHTRRAASLPAAPTDSLIRGVRAARRGHDGLRLVLGLEARARWRLESRSGRDGARVRIVLTAIRSAHRVAGEATKQVAPAGVAAASVVRAVRAPHAPPPGQRTVIVAVDPGHGGVDPGATGPDGVQEKDVTLAIARRLAADIDRTDGMHAVLTRTGDYFVPLRERMRLAHEAHADLFVSIHADSAHDHSASGASVYILSERGASSEAARRLAEQENAADLKGGISLAAQAPQLRSVLLDLSQDASMGESGEAAEDVLKSLDRLSELHKQQVQHAAFVVLKSPDVPSMLVETAYISNRADEHRLRSPVQQRRLAAAILEGITRYFRKFPPQGSLFARAHEVASQDSSS